MKVNNKVLSIPPYISTSWQNVASLHVENRQSHPLLVINLHSGAHIEIPQLDFPLIDAIFNAHAKFLEQEQLSISFKGPFPPGALAMGGPAGMESIGFVQHNPDQKDAPELPPEVLSKIALLAKTMSPQDLASLPQAEPHCNCPHCQITRAMQEAIQNGDPVLSDEEAVTEEDLRFRTWDIHKAADKLYVVTNPLNEKEKYNVYLGNPVGCTCGENGCEHVQAVLKS